MTTPELPGQPGLRMRAGTLGRLIILAVVAMMTAAGVCLVDGDEPASDGLCVSFLATAVALSLLVLLALTGYAAPTATNAYAVAAPDLPAPPPEA